MQIFMIYDKKLEGFMPDTVLCAANPAVALRRYADICKHITSIAEHAQDYEVYRICTIVDDSGELFDSKKAFLCSVNSLIPVAPTDEE